MGIVIGIFVAIMFAAMFDAAINGDKDDPRTPEERDMDTKFWDRMMH